MEEKSIQLIQLPVISHKLVEVGKNVSERINSLNLENQVATEDTVKTLKNLRADLNKEAKEFEDQRKIVKDALMSPYYEFENIYKNEIIDKYKSADSILKEKINDFEMDIKKKRSNNLVEYFNEICEIEQIDWLVFDRLNIEVNISTTEKKYKEQIFSAISGIVEDLDLIKTEAYSAEILVEYKKTLKASQSIREIRARKEAEKQENARIQMERTNRRTSQLRSLAFVFHDITKTYNWVSDESIMISLSEIEIMTNDEWIVKFAEIESKAKQPEQKRTAEAIHTPKVEEIQVQPVIEEKRAVFEVFGTYDQLMSVGEFLRQNQINYKNI